MGDLRGRRIAGRGGRSAGHARSDAELVVASHHDPEAFGELYRRHIGEVVTFFARRTADAEVTAELAAETFAVALETRDRFDPARGTPIAWIFGIARNLLRQYWRHRNVDDRARRRLGIATEVDRVSIDELDRVISRIDAGPILPLLDTLPSRQGLAVRLRVLDHATYSHIGIALGTNADNARLLVHRGLRALQQRLGEDT
ncbi:MAG: sigma-70 family RNA polymerase sigma factor [Actinomycetota bacterium]